MPVFRTKKISENEPIVIVSVIIYSKKNTIENQKKVIYNLRGVDLNGKARKFLDWFILGYIS